MQKTYMAKPHQVKRRWHLLDASKRPLGRLAAQAASLLRGKHKPIFTPHIDTGDHVIVINAEKAVLTGNKRQQKVYYYHTGYPGGIKQVSYAEMQAKQPERAIYMAVKRMLPKNRLGRAMLKKLRVYRGSQHPHQAQEPVVWEQELQK